MADESLVLTEVRGAVLVITINRPEARNSINKATAEAMGEVLDRLDADSSLSVGVITGTGKGFSAGMDLKGFASGEFPVAGDRGFAGIAQRSAKKPLIAAIEGFALAGVHHHDGLARDVDGLGLSAPFGEEYASAVFQFLEKVQHDRPHRHWLNGRFV